jgi:hypothetical protein
MVNSSVAYQDCDQEGPSADVENERRVKCVRINDAACTTIELSPAWHGCICLSCVVSSFGGAANREGKITSTPGEYFSGVPKSGPADLRKLVGSITVLV